VTFSGIPPDLNLLNALDVLLEEGSVKKAAARLRLSASAMSRTLARLRETTGDPLLVRAGGGLVPTPHAQALKDRVGALARQSREVLSPVQHGVDPKSLDRIFVLRTNEGFLEVFSPRIIRTLAQEAPDLTLIFAPKHDKAAGLLRDGRVDLDIGVVGLGDYGPEMRSCLLFRDGFQAVARRDHPIFSHDAITPAHYAASRHVVASRKGHRHGIVDQALASLGLRRRIVAVVPGFDDALRLAREADLVALVPRSFFRASAEPLLRGFALPVDTPEIAVSALWHPRLSADPAHRWIRDRIIGLCRDRLGDDA